MHINSEKNNQNLPNIVFLSVEALRFDRTGLSGYERPTTPNLDKLVQNSLWCSNCFALAPCTQPSMPSILSSTLPLSHGGYDFGVKDRPKTFPDLLADNGYWTEHHITVPWLVPTYGYGKHMSHSSRLFSLNGVVGAAIYTLRSTVRAWVAGTMANDEMLKIVSPIIDQCFIDVKEYCNEKLHHQHKGMLNKYFSQSKFANEEFDFESVLLLVQRHEAEFASNPKKYVEKYLAGLPLNARNSWIMRDVFKTKKLSRLPKKITSWTKFLLAQPLSWVTPCLAGLREKIYPDGSELTNLMINRIESLGKNDQPFFLWTHYFDTHTPYCPGEPPFWINRARNILVKLGYDKYLNFSSLRKKAPESIDEVKAWSSLYDCSVWYVDKQIGRIVEALKKAKVYENSIIIVTGDHGEELGEHCEFGHRFRFYDECLKVPLIIHSPYFCGKEIQSLTDLMDLAPTLASMLGLQSPVSWVGRDLSNNFDKRKYLISECFFRGSCLFSSKPVYMAVRTDRYKYIWREWVDPEDVYTQDRCELYDLAVDPAEQNNVFEQRPRVVKEMQSIVANRLSQIPEFIKNRTLKELRKAGISSLQSD